MSEKSAVMLGIRTPRMLTIRPVSNLRKRPVRAACLAMKPKNDEDPGILEGTLGSC